MDWNQKKKMMLRWSIVSAGLIALFWAIWYWKTGSVPVVHGIKMTGNWTVSLPFGMSRWWDILVGPIWAIIVILIFTNSKISEDEDLVVGLVAGLGVGLVFWLVVGLLFGLAAGLATGLGTGLEFIFSRQFWSAIGRWLLAQ